MSQLQSILSTDKFPARLVRHILFWIGQVCFWAFLNASIFGDKTTLQFLADDLRLHSFFVPDIIFTYFVTYFLAPRYLPAKQFRAFLLALGGATAVTYLFFLLMRFYDYGMFDAPVPRKLHLVWVYSIKFMNLGPPVICAMFLSLKFLKQYYQKAWENRKLVTENNLSQLGLLKAQIHPHFLFNTLSNIHSYALSNPGIASDLVSKLSDTLQYMIYDCEAQLVELTKEIKMIRDYMSLESVRYTEALNIKVDIDGDCSGKLVAPLFLIPLIENAYKHGTSQVLSDPWIDLRMTITDSKLYMTIRNGKPVMEVDLIEQTGGSKQVGEAESILHDGQKVDMDQSHQYANPGNAAAASESQAIAGFRSGIGLNNVRKRLALIFPGNHTFQVVNGESEFMAEIEIPLVPVNSHDINADNISISRQTLDKRTVEFV